MKRRPRILIGLSLLAVGIGLTTWIANELLFRHMGRVESLHSPIGVIGWTDAGLQTTDGNLVPIPGICHLPAKSTALAELTQRGIEIGHDGKVFGLARIWHWCGNDPISAEILRIDLSDALVYLQVGDPENPIPHFERLSREPGGSLNSDYGWNVSDFGQFQIWCSTKTSQP